LLLADATAVAQKHLFAGTQNSDFGARQFKHLPATCKRGFWAPLRAAS
jgi:hypothetical protein